MIILGKYPRILRLSQIGYFIPTPFKRIPKQLVDIVSRKVLHKLQDIRIMSINPNQHCGHEIPPRFCSGACKILVLGALYGVSASLGVRASRMQETSRKNWNNLNIKSQNTSTICNHIFNKTLKRWLNFRPFWRKNRMIAQVLRKIWKFFHESFHIHWNSFNCAFY